MRRSRVTIRDVAAHAGVSHQTVSRVINGSPRVRPTTRARVEDAIAQLGYRPNAIARSMARGETNTLACIAPNLTDYTFASIIDGAETEARQHGYALVAASAWEVTKSAFGWFLSSGLVRHQLVYGSLGTVVALMLWIYLSSLITLFGAHLSAAITHHNRMKEQKGSSRGPRTKKK